VSKKAAKRGRRAVRCLGWPVFAASKGDG
jgi:hypothetical protein